MPSDLFHAGANARRSLPASTRAAGPRGRGFAPKYGTSSQLAQIADFMARCGSGRAVCTDALSAC